jgi:hypothetical protein
LDCPFADSCIYYEAKKCWYNHAALTSTQNFKPAGGEEDMHENQQAIQLQPLPFMCKKLEGSQCWKMEGGAR